MENKEYLLQPVSNRFTLLPIKHKKLYDLFKQHEANFWTTEEIDLKDDIKHWETLNDNEKYFIKNVLAFFAGSDGIVNENLVVNFYNDIEIPEVRAFYTMQMLSESIHCVAPETQILTDKGYFEIKSLCNNKVNVWNGKEWSEVEVKKTADKAKLYTVELSNGMSLDCTSKHKWYIEGKEEYTYTEDLCKDDKIVSNWSYPVLDIENKDECDKMFYVPINHSIKTKIQWIQENFVRDRKELDFSHSKGILKNVQFLLTTLNVKSNIGYFCDDIYYLKLEEEGFLKLRDLGLNFSNWDKKELTMKVLRVIYEGRIGETYCFNEPKNHTGIFNGILTGQSETYGVLIDSLIKDEDEKHKLFNAIETIPAVKKKAEWALKWIGNEQNDIINEYKKNPTKDNLEKFVNITEKFKDNKITNKVFTKRLLAFILVEGLFFSGSFCAIFWLKNRGLMPGLSFSNELISKDEGIHALFGIELYHMIKNKLDEKEVCEMFLEAVAIEKEFITKSLPVSLIGMNCETMKTYIEFVADKLLIELGYKKLYNVKECPFKFMELLSFSGGNSKVNFFEKRNSDYIKSSVGKNQEDSELVFDDDF